MKWSILTMLVCGFIQVLVAQSMRNLGEFSSLKVVGSLNIELIPAQLNKIEYKIFYGQESDFISDINSGELEIKFKNQNYGLKKAKAEVKVYYKYIDELKISGGANLISHMPIVADYLSVDCSSGARANIAIESNKASFTNSSGSSITVSGKTNDCTINTSSGASFSGNDLEAKNVIARASSGSSINTKAIELLDINSSGGGKIDYSGEPKKLKINGGYGGSFIKG